MMKRRIKKTVGWFKRLWAMQFFELIVVIIAGILLIYALLIAFKFIRL